MEVRPVEDYVELLQDLSTVQNVELKNAFLARQTNYEPLSNVNPKLVLYPLDQLNKITSNSDLMRVQESLVVHDLLDNLMGLSGTYIRYNNEFNPYNGDVPEFKIAKKMDASLKSFSKTTLQYGSYFVSLNNASERWSDIKYGVVLQSLSYVIKSFINDIYLPLLVNKLERSYHEDPTFSIRELKQLLNDSEIGKQLTLLHNLVSKIEDEMITREKTDLQQLSREDFLFEVEQFNGNDDLSPIFIERKISPIAKGGTILKILYKMILECLGDTTSMHFLQNLLIKISDNYYKTLHGWMTQGELNDPCDEFMIINTMTNINNINILNPIQCDRIWLTQYGIRKDGLLDKFTSSNDKGNNLLFKILSTGKLLNVIKRSLELNILPIRDEDFPMHSTVSVSNFVELMEGTNFELYVDQWYQRANKICLTMLVQGFKLPEVMENLSRWYFGFNNDYHVNKILQDSLVELTRHYSDKNSGVIENRIKIKFNNGKRQCDMNDKDMILKLMVVQLDKESFHDVIMQYINSELQTIGNANKLNNLDSIRDIVMQEFEEATTNIIKPPSDKPINKLNNIHYMKMDIGIPFPLNVIINRSCILQYQLINRYLNLLRYHNIVLEETWIEINKNYIWKYTGFNNEIKSKIIRRSRLIHNGMNNFIKSILEYFVQDVIVMEMSKCETLDDVMEIQSQLAESLTNILHDGCLMKLIEIQLQIFDIINKFCKFLLSMRRKLVQLDYNLYERFQDGVLTYDEEDNLVKIPEYIEFIKTVSQSFQDHRHTLLEGLWYHYQGKDHPLFKNSMGNDDSMSVITHGSRLITSSVNVSLSL